MSCVYWQQANYELDVKHMGHSPYPMQLVR